MKALEDPKKCQIIYFKNKKLGILRISPNPSKTRHSGHLFLCITCMYYIYHIYIYIISMYHMYHIYVSYVSYLCISVSYLCISVLYLCIIVSYLCIIVSYLCIILYHIYAFYIFVSASNLLSLPGGKSPMKTNLQNQIFKFLKIALNRLEP